MLGASFFVALPVLGDGGLGLINVDAFIGEMPSTWFETEPCHNGTITVFENALVQEYQIDTTGVANDGDPNTFLKCTAVANAQELRCLAGLPDGTVVSCMDDDGPHVVPHAGNVVYMQFPPGVPDEQTTCNILVGTGDKFGIADPKCRSGGDGDVGDGDMGDGDGDGSPGVCDASTADAMLTTGQSTNIASDACVQLKNETSWSTIDPNLQAVSGTASYPVSFSYTSCSGNGSGSLTGDWQTAYLLDGVSGAQSNPGCDIFLQLEGDGSQVSFSYYE